MLNASLIADVGQINNIIKTSHDTVWQFKTMPVPTMMKAFTFQNKWTICETHQYAGSQTTKSQTSLQTYKQESTDLYLLHSVCSMQDAAYCCHLQLLALKCEVADTCMLCNGHKGVTFVGCKKTSSLKNLWGSPLPWPLYTLYCWLHRLLALGAFIYLWLRVHDFVKATSTEDRTILYCILLYFV